jgi:hypothetical protein
MVNAVIAAQADKLTPAMQESLREALQAMLHEDPFLAKKLSDLDEPE